MTPLSGIEMFTFGFMLGVIVTALAFCFPPRAGRKSTQSGEPDLTVHSPTQGL